MAINFKWTFGHTGCCVRFARFFITRQINWICPWLHIQPTEWSQSPSRFDSYCETTKYKSRCTDMFWGYMQSSRLWRVGIGVAGTPQSSRSAFRWELHSNMWKSWLRFTIPFRYDPDPDPKGGLLKLSPPFPFEDEHLANKYWAKNYAIITLRNGLVIATLNSSAYHGGKQEEILHGRVSRRTIDALSSDLQSTREASGHVLVCHHHPLPLSGWTSGANDTEFMKNGQDLLDALIDATGRSWLIIHGHRHKPRLISGASSRSAVPFVIGAGSLGRVLREYQTNFTWFACTPPRKLSIHLSSVRLRLALGLMPLDGVRVHQLVGCHHSVGLGIADKLNLWQVR